MNGLWNWHSLTGTQVNGFIKHPQNRQVKLNSIKAKTSNAHISSGSQIYSRLIESTYKRGEVLPVVHSHVSQSHGRHCLLYLFQIVHE